MVGWSVLREPANDAAADIDPLSLRIDRREEGSWQSVTTKINLTSASGSKTLYFVIGFGVVCGRLSGERVCIERPLEFFVPAGQTAAEHQWVSATMRTLSLAARGGFLVKALADLRKVSWDRGPVWYGRSKSGKGLVHDSEVAAIAWAIQQELQRRGYLDEHGNERPVAELAAHYANTRAFRDAPARDAGQSPAAAPMPPLPGLLAERCPQCRGGMAMKDGCPTCLDCGWSKCG
ncbi:ribonucleoside-diphosphate reductase [Solimonas terrae]|uniref:Ribonucleoside-diphosphate reductase n=1 Tax=Solimonas terrae TaxID=1396819 RepID=A0A6M2BVM9_9GAMM|nr:ribonucleoside-diphosphate reductase [Solimonas terrae]